MRTLEKYFRFLGDLSWFALIVFGFGTIILFCTTYYSLSFVSPSNGLSSGQKDFLASLYFSVSAFISQSYGEIIPLGVSKAFAIIEGLLGLFFLTLLISKIVSIRQESMISRIYHRSYIDFFKDMRDDINKQRVQLKEISDKLQQNLSDTQLIEIAKIRIYSNKGIFRILSSIIGGLNGFLSHEMEREELIMKEIDPYHMERIIHTLQSTIQQIQISLDTLEKADLKTSSRGRNNLDHLLDNIENLNELIDGNFTYENLHKKSMSIRDVITIIRSTALAEEKI